MVDSPNYSGQKFGAHFKFAFITSSWERAKGEGHTHTQFGQTNNPMRIVRAAATDGWMERRRSTSWDIGQCSSSLMRHCVACLFLAFPLRCLVHSYLSQSFRLINPNRDKSRKMRYTKCRKLKAECCVCVCWTSTCSVHGSW